MWIQIDDWTGNWYSAKVTSERQLSVSAVTRTIAHEAAHEGNTYQIATDMVTINTWGTYGVFYLKYT